MIRVIAEAGMCDNDLTWAHRAVDAALDAGAWGFKVQLLSPDRIAARFAPRYDRLPGPETQYEAFTGALPYEAWAEVKAHCDELGLEFFASAWDLEALDALAGMGCRWIKVGSADITYRDLIVEAAGMFPNMILSTGATTWHEVHRAIGWADEHLDEDGGLVVMACTLSYPCYEEDAYLNRVKMFAETRGLPPFEIGYSDHTTMIETAGLAVVAGATYLEKHFSITPRDQGDHAFAVPPEGLRRYVESARQAERMLGPRQWEVLPNEIPARVLARRSLHTITEIDPGEELEPGLNCRWLRPVPTGALTPDAPLGRMVAAVALPAGSPVTKEDLAR